MDRGGEARDSMGVVRRILSSAFKHYHTFCFVLCRFARNSMSHAENRGVLRGGG